MCHTLNIAKMLAVSALMSVFALPGIAAAGQTELLAQNVDCYSTGERVAAQRGGSLVQATPERQGGQTVCRVVVVIPSGSGQRPKRVEFVVPAN